MGFSEGEQNSSGKKWEGRSEVNLQRIEPPEHEALQIPVNSG